MDEEKLDSLLNEYLDKCSEAAKELLQGCNAVELLRIAFMKRSDNMSMLEDYDENFSTPEEAFDLVLNVNDSEAFYAVACEFMKKLPNDEGKNTIN